jgi:hypothetical protein
MKRGTFIAHGPAANGADKGEDTPFASSFKPHSLNLRVWSLLFKRDSSIGNLN